MIPITWPFAVWGLDLVGLLQKSPGGFTHLLVAIDKFSKWIEAWPIAQIKSEQAVIFFTDIIHHFKVPNSIITDNGTQFTGKKFLDFYDDHHIHVNWAVVAHPRMNGPVERAKGMILQGLKPRIFNQLNKFGRRWVTKHPTVLWSLRKRQVSRLSSWTMDPRPSSLLTWSMERQGSERTMTKGTKLPLKTSRTSWRKHMTSPYSTLPSTSKPYAGATIAACGVEHSTSGT
jgi:transposase InsO family protein